MICVSIANPTPESCAVLLKTPGLEMAELRLEGVELSRDQLEAIFSAPIPLIATCRPTGLRGESRRLEVLLTAIAAGAAYVDVELEAGPDFLAQVLHAAQQKNCAVIISYHNYLATPNYSELQQILGQCFSLGATIAKIACFTHTPEDCARLLALYGEVLEPQAGAGIGLGRDNLGRPRQVLALGMGEAGKITRLAAPFLGAPFTFAAFEPGQETAPGQLSLDALKTIFGLLK